MITTNSSGGTLWQDYSDIINQSSRQFQASLYVDDVLLDCEIVNARVTKGACSSSEFSVGNIISSTLEATVKNCSASIKDKKIQLRIGLQYNNNIEWITLGTWYVIKAKNKIDSNNDKTTEITAYGAIAAKLTQKIDPMNNWSLTRLANEIYGKSGIRVTVNRNLIPDYARPDDAKEELTTYQALQLLAICGLGFATETPDGEILVRGFNNPDIITGKDYNLMLQAPDLEEKDFTVTGITITKKEGYIDDDGTEVPPVAESYGTPNLQVYNKYSNSFLNLNEKRNVVDYSYRPGTVYLSLGDPRIEAGDMLQVTMTDGNTVNVACHEVVHTFDGGFSTEIRAAKATNEADGIGTKTQNQKLLAELNSTVQVAKDKADNAVTIANTTQQHFWFEETGTHSGVHITEIPKEDFITDPANGGGNLLARSNGIAVRDGLSELAQFSRNGVVVGLDGSCQIEVSPYNMELRKGTNNYFAVKNLEGESELTTIFYADGTQNFYNLGATIKSVISATINGSTASYTIEDTAIYFPNETIYDGYEIEIHWVAEGAIPVFIFGRVNDVASMGVGAMATGFCCEAKGQYSHAEGDMTKAIGSYSHAEGYETIAKRNYAHSEGAYSEANGQYSHAEGFRCNANGESSHAEGYNNTVDGRWSHAQGRGNNVSGDNSHAEGSTNTVSGSYSHAEGYNNTVDGNFSHAGGQFSEANQHCSFAYGDHVEADEQYQSVFGRYNDYDSDAIFIVGNGTSDSNRKNVLAVKKSGNLAISGTLSQSSDKRLKKHVSYLGEDADEFIRKLKPAVYEKDEENNLGFYAQDVEEADSWGCLVDEFNGYKSLKYTDLIAPLVSYCQHLEKRIEELEKGVNNGN